MIPDRSTYIQDLQCRHAIALQNVTQAKLDHDLAQSQAERTRAALESARRDLRILETAFQRESGQAGPSRSPAMDSDCSLRNKTDTLEFISLNDSDEEATGTVKDNGIANSKKRS